MNDKLKNARKNINEIDRQMAELFVKRMEASKEVAEFKKEHGMPIFDSAREEEVIRNNSNLIENDEIRGYYTNFLRNTMQTSKNYQRKLIEGMRVAYSGIEGAFAHIATSKLFPDALKVPFSNFKDAYDAVVSGDCDACVLPLENSYAGEVGQVTDLLFSGPLYINGTYELSVTHDLLAPKGAKLEDIKEIISHPQAISQCAQYIKRMGFKETPYENTALAARFVAEKNDKTVAAIASKDSAELYGLEVLAEHINQSETNTTRFAILSRSENKNNSKVHGANFAIMFTVRNEAGSLARALNIIGAHGFNLRTLRSRPMKELMWQYYFYAEAEGNIHSADGEGMLESLKICCDLLKLVGSFVKHNETEEK